MKRLLGAGAVAAAVVVAARTYRRKQRAIAMVPEELRHPVLWAPFRLTSRTVVRAVQALPVRPAPVAPG